MDAQIREALIPFIDAVSLSVDAHSYPDRFELGLRYGTNAYAGEREVAASGTPTSASTEKAPLNGSCQDRVDGRLDSDRGARVRKSNPCA
jgi:hypothetical protein